MIKIHFINWWTQSQPYGDFFHRFIERYINQDVVFDHENPDIVFCSVFGHRDTIIRWIKNHPKCFSIFFTGECLNIPRWSQYKGHLLDVVNLALGFEYIDHKNYMRFPLWLTYIDIQGMGKASLPFKQLQAPQIPQKQKFCCLLNNHDFYHTRTEVFHAITTYKNIDSAGGWNKTVQYKIPEGEHHKQIWMQSYKFNLCCESFLQKGYVTEKVFESLMAGCIPIYIINDETKEVESEVLNQDWILKFTKDELPKMIDQVKRLDTDEEEYKRFIEQPRLTDRAVNFIENKYKELENKLAKLL